MNDNAKNVVANGEGGDGREMAVPQSISQHVRALRSQELLFAGPTDPEDNGVETDEPNVQSDGPRPWSVAGKKRKFKKPRTPRASSDGELVAHGPSPPRKAVRKSGDSSCCCGNVVQGAVWISCTKCSAWFHIDCVHLTGLTTEHIKLLKKWVCLKCATGTELPTREEVRQIVRQELAVVKEDLVSVTKSVQSGVKNDVKTYANIIQSGQKEVLQAATAPALVKDVCQTMHVEQMERKKKRKNVVITNVPEATPTLSGDQKREHDISYMCSDKVKMVRGDISTCYRVGRVKKDENGALITRPVVVVFHNEDCAMYWHNDGKGYRIGEHWVNEDLCRSDREAKFFVRQQRRNRQQQQLEGQTDQQGRVPAAVK